MRVSKNRVSVNTTEAYLESEGVDLEYDIIGMYRINIGQNSHKNTMVVGFVDEPRLNYFYPYKPDSNELFLLDTRIHHKE